MTTVRWLCRGEAQRFTKQLLQPEATQDRLLKSLLRDLSKTSFGKQHHITGTERYEDFVRKIPIQDYNSLEPSISEQLTIKTPIITPQRIMHIEPTSGSSGRRKLIPYTPGLLNSFFRLFKLWAYDQLTHGFMLTTGKLFISISPPQVKEASHGQSAEAISPTGHGFSDERDYLKQPLRMLLEPFLVFPQRLASDPNHFQRTLAMTLLSEPALEVISIWSPSYLLVLLDYIQTHKQTLAKSLPPERQTLLLEEPIHWPSIWPELKLISCWDSGMAAPLAEQIRHLFPAVHVQGKGLLATEASVTLPLIHANGCVPLVGEVFLEFETNTGDIKRLHQLHEGDEAEIIITQKGGLTRYRLYDRIRVEQCYKNTPTLLFLGRANQVCDLVGEKLNEAFVNSALLPLCPSGNFLLLPYQEIHHNATVSGYTLLTNEITDNLGINVEKALCQTHHYQLARQLKQLESTHVLFHQNLQADLLQFYQQEGMKLGDIKECRLICDLEKARRLLAFLNLHVPNPRRI